MKFTKYLRQNGGENSNNDVSINYCKGSVTMSDEQRALQTELAKIVGEETATKFIGRYVEITDKLRSVKQSSRPQYYQKRKGIEVALVSLGVTEETMNDFKSSLRPSTDRKHYVEIIAKKDARIAELTKQLQSETKK